MKLPDDPYVVELLPEFVDQWIQDIDNDFDKHFQAKNANDMYRFAHTIKGSCLQFGLDEIASKGIELMGYCKKADWSKIEPMGDNIRQSFIEVKKYLDNNS